MKNFYDKFEMEQVLSNLQSSYHMENKLMADYEEALFQRIEYKRYKKKMPLLIKELYLLILKVGDLPSLKQFEEAYQNKYHIKKNNYFSEMTALKKAYRSFVRDLHFYFLLKESDVFDTVKVDYLFDLRAQTDILLSKGDKKIGLQLFNGGRNIKSLKQQHYKKAKGENNFELVYFGTESKGERKKLNTTSGATFILYSEDDVQTVYQLLLNSVKIESLVDSEQCDQYDEFVESITLTKPGELSELEVHHSVLEIGRRTAQEVEKLKQSLANRGIVYYYCELDITENIVIKDGQNFAQYEHLLEEKELPEFNLEQYKIEHALANLDIAVMAGAGSGKTYTLVSRTLFLLNMGFVQHVYQIAMITFTNEAANNILENLEKRFLQMYKNTHDNRFLRFLDELREMKIMTIPAFAKFILKEYGHQIGIGQSFRISTLSMKKREFIEHQLNQVYKTNQLEEGDFAGIEYYQMREFVEAFSEKVEQKGIFAESLVPHLKDENPFEVLIVNALAGVEQQLSDIKQERDILGLSDLTRYLKRLIDNEVSMNSLANKFNYLFVDEFQDTDSLQIEFIVNLAVKANIPLLVVGDIKQGIYRFRGANVSAFELISEFLGMNNRVVVPAKLLKNYRTSGDILNRLEDIFDSWKRYGHLAESDRMIPTKLDSQAAMSYIECHRSINEEAILTLFDEMKNRPHTDEREIRVLTVLVRTNAKVGEINSLLRQSCMNRGIPIHVVKDGTLFKTKAAKDLLSVLYAWLNPIDEIAIFELAQTAFCKPVTLPTLQCDDFYEMDDFTFDLPQTWDVALEQFKLAPGLIVLNEFLKNTPYDKHLLESLKLYDEHSSKNEKQFEIEVKQYILNMNKIMTLMSNAMQSENVDLYSLYNWLKIEVATNNRDDEAELTDADMDQDYIKVMTVHKSKGLEFDTVVIPYVKDKIVLPYERKCEILVEADSETAEYSWHYKASNEFVNVTANYAKMREDEKPQLLQEETRNLYVALTRAKECLAIFDMKDQVSDSDAQNPNSWLHLIKGGRNNDVNTCFNLCNCRSTL